jgi:hypothetical protein
MPTTVLEPCRLPTLYSGWQDLFAGELYFSVAECEMLSCIYAYDHGNLYRFSACAYLFDSLAVSIAAPIFGLSYP